MDTLLRPRPIDDQENDENNDSDGSGKNKPDLGQGLRREKRSVSKQNGCLEELFETELGDNTEGDEALNNKRECKEEATTKMSDEDEGECKGKGSRRSEESIDSMLREQKVSEATRLLSRSEQGIKST